MGFLKFVIPFLGGAVAAAAVNVAMQIKNDIEDSRTDIEIDAEFVEVPDNESNGFVDK